MMPVRFKGSSEYKTHYKWQESYRSQSFKPSAEQSMWAAGQASVNASVTMEPPLQHKKRLEGPPTSLSYNYFDEPSKDPEYALLGQQEKFAPNVQYKPKQTAVVKAVYKNKENFGDDAPPNKQLRMQKRIKPLIKERHPPLREPRAPEPKAENPSPISPPPAPRFHVETKEALKDKDLKDVLGDVPTKKVDTAKPSKVKQVEPSNMNEFVQTNMGKGVADSAPEAPAEYALKYKAGVAPPRPLKKMSEYQKQFQWKAGMKASPLLAAEQVVYQSHADLGPYKSEAIPKMSEYKRQFQEWSPLTLPEDAHLNLNQNNKGADEIKPVEKKTTMKRSKSAGAVLKADESHENVEEKEEETSKDRLKTKLKKNHGKIRRLGTEYRNNFKAPTSFSYDHGAWKGASPPQLLPQEGKAGVSAKEGSQTNSSENPPLSSWFAEVLELRRRAQEYRKRAEGTHFSREHLVQLMAKQNQCWDVNSNGSRTLRALDLEVPAGKPGKMDEVVGKEPLQPTQVCKQQTEDRVKKTGSKDQEGEEQGKSRLSRKMAWLEEQKEKVEDQRRQLEEQRQREEYGDIEDDAQEIVEGRLPTPVLKSVVEPPAARRHHLDLTTPAIGGALLTCPPSKDSKLIVTSRSGDSYVTASDDMPVKSKKQTYDMEKLLTMPTWGKPSGDTHALRDETAESDRPLATQYVASPLLHLGQEDKENKSVKSPGKRKGRRSKATNLTTVKEGYGKTYKQQQYLTLDDVNANSKDRCQQDDDVMSVSLMSVASSETLASDVLERAKRRQNFWGKKN